MARVSHDGLPIPKGCSISEPLGAMIEKLSDTWRSTCAEEVASRLLDLSRAHVAFYPHRLPKKGPLFTALVQRGRMLWVLLRSVTRGTDASAASRLLAIFEAYGPDPRIWPFLERWTMANIYPNGNAFSAALGAVVDAWELREKELRAAARALTDEDRSVLDHADELLRSMPKRHAALALLNDVYANPTDISRRLVLADALMDLGDAWGELIAIQCARLAPNGAPPPSSTAPSSGRAISPRQREEDLLEAGAFTWLGRMAPSVMMKNLVFEGGFPATVTLMRQRPRVEHLAEWSTVNEVVDLYRPSVRRKVRA